MAAASVLYAPPRQTAIRGHYVAPLIVTLLRGQRASPRGQRGQLAAWPSFKLLVLSASGGADPGRAGWLGPGRPWGQLPSPHPGRSGRDGRGGRRGASLVHFPACCCRSLATAGAERRADPHFSKAGGLAGQGWPGLAGANRLLVTRVQ